MITDVFLAIAIVVLLVAQVLLHQMIRDLTADVQELRRRWRERP
jgi:hypothetical protein